MTEPNSNPNIIMRQRWSEMLFLHWAVDPDTIQDLLPDDLTVDTFDGRAYIGIVAFSMSNVALSFFAPIPGMSDFLECNVRTYVRLRDHTMPGIWFFSLDAANAVMAAMARASYSLPYYFASMSMKQTRTETGGTWQKTVSYETQRTHPGAPPAMCAVEYEPIQGNVSPARLGSLDEFLIERYLLYAVRGKELYSARVHHARYQIEPVRVLSLTQTMTEAAGVKVPESEPLAHFTREILADVEPLLIAQRSAERIRSKKKLPGALPQPA